MTETFEALYRQATELFAAQDYAAALALMEREGAQYPDEAINILYLESCAAARLGQLERAEAFLAEVLDRGLWYDEMMLRQSPSWLPLQGRPEFERLAALHIARAQHYVGTPRCLVAEPLGGIQQGQTYPLIIALHGNLDTGAKALQAWQPATADGWIVAALQSSQAHQANGYIWDDTDLATQEILHHFVELTQHYQIDRTRIVLIGFSMGASTVLRLALTDALPMCGFILLGPGAPGDDWMPTIPTQRSATPLRGAVLYGEREDQPEGIHDLIAALQSLDIPMQLEILPGLAHEYPQDNGASLRRALAFLLG